MTKRILILATILAFTIAHAATNDLTGLLQQGLFEEEANRNLDAAISNYQSLANAFDKDRQVAATAIFRLGECYRKLGHTNEATAQYQRILHEFSDQQTLVTLSQQNLAGLGASAQSATQTESSALSEQERELELVKKLQAMPLSEVLQAGPTLLTDATLINLIYQYNQTELNLIRLRTDHGEQHPEVMKEKTMESALQDKIKERLEGIAQALSLELGTAQNSSESTTRTESVLSQLMQTREAQIEARTLQDQYNRFKGMTKTELRIAIEQNYPNPVLTKLMQEEADASQQLVKLKADYDVNHPRFVSAKEVLDAIDKQIDEQVDGAMKDLEAKINEAFRSAQRSQQQISSFQPTANAQPLITDEEEKEIRRIQAMIQNSPDLINAPGGDPPLTPLARAASLGQLSVAKFLLNAKADVNLQRGGVPPLQYAAINGHRAMVELLLANGADVNAKDWQGRTALLSAAEHGFISVAEALLAAKADVNARDPQGNTPLTLAVRSGSRPAAELLLSHGADPNIITSKSPPTGPSNDNMGAPLHIAIWNQDEPMVSLLLSNHANVQLRNPSGNKTTLDMAAERPDVEIARRLLDAGANPNPERANAGDPTPLYRAVASGNTNMVKLLLAKGADINQTCYLFGGPSENSHSGPLGTTPLMRAVYADDEPMVLLLLQNKANPNLKNDGGNTAFGYGPGTKDGKTLITLLENGTDPNQPANDGLLPLMGVTQWQNFHSPTDRVLVAKALISKGANLNAKDGIGNTALHWAVTYDRPELVDLLLANKADANAQNHLKKTPLDFAKAGENGSIPYALVYGLKYGGQFGTDRERQQKIASLLTQAGGVANLPQLDQIQVTRPSANFSQTLFWQDTNNWNQVSLFDVLGVQYQLLSGSPQPTGREISTQDGVELQRNSLSFPNFKRIVIHRPFDRGTKWKDLPVNVDQALESGDCSADVMLQFGDVVEIPEADHVMNQAWTGLKTNQLFNLVTCVTRHVRIIVKGQSSTVTIAPDIEPVRELTRSYIQMHTFKPLMLWPALQESKLLLWSSDLSRIQVKRHDPVTGKMLEWTVDCSNPQSPPNFWLRDGDVIEVPEKAGE